jgi:K+-transporting ATPase KdpF subunit
VAFFTCCSALYRGAFDESHGLAAGDVFARTRNDGFDVRFLGGLRESLNRGRLVMIWLTILVTIFLFVYLLAALLRPEWF